MGNDTYVKNLLSGRFETSPQGLSLSLMALTFIGEGLTQLYHLFPAFPWFDWMIVIFSTLAFSALCLSVTLFSTPQQTKTPGGISLNLVLSLLASFCLYYENFLLVEFLRVSIVLSVSILLILFTCKLNYKQYIFATFLLLLDDLFRLETFPYSLLLMLPVCLFRTLPFRQILVRLITPAILYITLFTINNTPFSPREQQYLAFRPYQFVLIDYKVTPKKSAFDSPADSLTMDMAKRFFLNDERIITPAFFNKYFYPQDKDPLHLLGYLQHTDYSLSAWKQKLNSVYPYYFLLLLFIPLFFIIYFAFCRGTLAKAMVIMFYYACFVVAVALFMKIETRVLYPTFIAFVLIMLYGLNRSALIGRGANMAIILALLPFCYSVGKQVLPLHQQIAKQRIIEDRMKVLSETAPVTFVCDLHQFNYSGIRPFDPVPEKLRCISFDNGLGFMNKEYKDDCIREFGTAETDSILQQVIAKNKTYIWIGEVQRLQLLQTYFKDLHNIAFTYHMSIEDSVISAEYPHEPVIIHLEK